MDVLIRLSLAGGHSWEFVCDEDDPMVMGIVSALPGASVDAALPPDGLIQVESRSGERLFLTRSSLVAVSIRRLAPAPVMPEVPEAAWTSLQPKRLVLLQGAFPAEDLAAIAALPAFAKRGDGIEAIEQDSLPAEMTARLIAIVAEAARALHLAEEPTHLDLGLLRIGGSGGQALPRRGGAGALVEVVVALGGGDGMHIGFADLTAGGAGSEPPADGAAAEVRRLPLTPGDALFVATGTSAKPKVIDIPAAAAPAILLAGSLCRGAGLASP